MVCVIFVEVNQRYVMKTKTLIAAFGMVVMSAFAAHACAKHSEQAMSCAEGTAWDSESETCVPQTSS